MPNGTAKADYDWQEWCKIVDGASLLGDLFAKLSECRVEYRKTRHSPLLTEWLIRNHKEELKELGDFLREFLDECEQCE